MLRLFVIETFFVILVSIIAIMSKFLFVQLRRCWGLSKFLLKEHVFVWNKESDLLLFVTFRFSSFSVSYYLDETVFSGSSELISLGDDDIFLNWFTKCFNFSERFSNKQLFLSSMLLDLLLLS